MANDDHIAQLMKGVEAWNAWRDEHADIVPDLSSFGLDLAGANLRGANLSGVNLMTANLSRADLRGANLTGANLKTANLGRADLEGANLAGANLKTAHLFAANLRHSDLHDAYVREAQLSQANLSMANLGAADLAGADLRKANLQFANLTEANLRGAWLSGAVLHLTCLAKADLTGALLIETILQRVVAPGAKLVNADLTRANLREADLSGANLSGADLEAAILLETNLADADLTSCRVYGISAWDLNLERTKQQNLVITRGEEPEITVDNIEVAQFVYLLLHNEKIRDVIDTITSKAVLILGRFTDERKAVLDALREELRRRDYLPILFDFAVPATRDITETVSLLARMARFIIADLTDPSSIPQELQAIVPHLAVPVQPLLEASSRSYAMFKDLLKYEWVLPVYRYEGLEPLLATLAEKVIGPAEGKVKALQERRRMIEAELTKPQ
jgi:uncharacterized protein YjbI with pentapeptide repeats